MPGSEINGHPSLGHVNLMLDTLIANLGVDDFRAIMRSLLSNGTPGFASAFTTAARSRLRHTNAKTIPEHYTFFTKEPSDQKMVPTPQLNQVLERARGLYGAGMGFGSLNILTAVVRATSGIRWEEDGDIADALAAVDADIAQAIQSSREEMERDRVVDLGAARQALKELRSAIRECFSEVESWGGEFPFERAAFGVEFLKI